MHGQVSALMKAMNDEWNLIKHQHSDEWHADVADTDPNEEGLLPGEKDMLTGTPGLGKMKYNFFDPEWVHTKGPGGCLRGAMKSNQLKMDGTFDKVRELCYIEYAKSASQSLSDQISFACKYLFNFFRTCNIFSSNQTTGIMVLICLQSILLVVVNMVLVLMVL